MATLTPTLTLTSTDATTDQLAFSVTDSLSVTHPHQGLSKVSVTTTGADTVIIPNLDARRYFFLRHTGVDTSGSTVTTDLKVEETDENWFSRLAPGEFLWVPLGADGAHKIQLETTGGTIVAEYAYWTKA
jgi:putative NIF3 family GTP cyclohydrolase 1 type 2